VDDIYLLGSTHRIFFSEKMLENYEGVIGLKFGHQVALDDVFHQ
jgi:hypothetical protein